MTRIPVDPTICNGKVCIHGTRIQVAMVLDKLAKGLSVDEIVAG